MAYASRNDVLGSVLTTLQVGGPCREVLHAHTEADLAEAVRDRPQAICIGGGSNLLIADAGFGGTLIRAVAADHGGIEITGAEVDVAATLGWDEMVRVLVGHDLQGLEATAGIPGSVGGAIVQNAGAYGQEISDVLVRVRAWDRIESRPKEFDVAECGFAYRTSRFKHDSSRRYVITGTTLRLERSNRALPRYGDVSRLLLDRTGHEGPYPLRQIYDAVIAVRTTKGMVLGASAPSAGSFFTNPVVDEDQARALQGRGITVTSRADGARLVSAAVLMEGAGYEKGYRLGRAGLSDKHVLAIVNLGGATAADLIALATEVREGVHTEFGVWLRPEPVMLGFETAPFSS